MLDEKIIKPIPRHIGIIMDGNGRWATLRGKKRSFGHKAGSDNVDRVVTHAFSRGVKAVTLYAFSSENWSRPKEEVDELMRLLEKYFEKFIGKVIEKKVKLNIIGDVSALSNKLQKIIYECEEKSKVNSDFILNIGINYGGRQEVCTAVNKLIKDKKEITIDGILDNLYTKESGEPDLIIRTGGEYRLSNFLLFQSAYSELYFTKVLWPDFNEEELDKAIDEFGNRHRRFGGV